MIVHKVEGGTEEWKLLRCGIACSSEFHKIITPKTQQLSKQSPGYMYRLLYEWISGAPWDGPQTDFMQRGQELEFEAVKAYEMLTGYETDQGGFVTTDDGLAGCSPDRTIGTVGDLEVKCPAGPTQVEYALTGIVGDDYMTQLQGRIWIREIEWVDIFSYHPRLAIPPLRVHRNEEYIKNLSEGVRSFVDVMVRKRAELEQRFGPFVRERLTDEQAPDELSFLGRTEEDLSQWIEQTR